MICWTTDFNLDRNIRRKGTKIIINILLIIGRREDSSNMKLEQENIKK